MATPANYQAGPSVTFIEAVRECFKKYGDFSGRAPRPEYWWWLVGYVIAGSILATIDTFIVSLLDQEDAFSPLYLVFVLAMLLPSLAVTSRRLHDIGRSGWWLLVWIGITSIGWIPVALGVTAFALGLLDEWSGTNVEFVPVILGGFLTLVVQVSVFIWMVLWLTRQGEAGPNSYGPSPRPAAAVVPSAPVEPDAPPPPAEDHGGTAPVEEESTPPAAAGPDAADNGHEETGSETASTNPEAEAVESPDVEDPGSGEPAAPPGEAERQNREL